MTLIAALEEMANALRPQGRNVLARPARGNAIAGNMPQSPNAMLRPHDREALAREMAFAQQGPKPSPYPQQTRDYLGRVVSGEIAMEGLNRIADLGDKAMRGDVDASIELANEFGGAGVIAGKLAKTADLYKLAKAKQMVKSKVSRDKIWKETGWFKGVDGKWKFEIDDSAARYDADALMELKSNKGFDYLGDTQPMGGVMEHKKLYQAYPDAEDIPVHFMPADKLQGKAGAYARKHDRITLADIPDNQTSISLHELQHGIQQREGFSGGGNIKEFMGPNSVYSDYQDYVRKINKKADAMESVGLAGDAARLREKISLRDYAEDQYKSLAGEAEARAVQTRMDLTPAQRAARPFWQDFDVPERDQIVRFK